MNRYYFDNHDSHWDADAMDMMYKNNMQGFILKASDSMNDQPNDNGFNAQEKTVYCEERQHMMSSL